MCRAITVLDLWAMTASFYWLLIEGIQLYTLLVVTVFSVKNRVVHASYKSYPWVKIGPFYSVVTNKVRVNNHHPL